MWKKAARLKVRFVSRVGALTSEQLWELRLDDLKDVVKEAYKRLKSLKGDKESELSFLEECCTKGTPELEKAQVTYDIAKDVWETRTRELAEKKEELEKKKYNQHIDELIAKKKEQVMENLSIEELEKLRK